jgi:hypothetical protein
MQYTRRDTPLRHCNRFPQQGDGEGEQERAYRHIYHRPPRRQELDQWESSMRRQQGLIRSPSQGLKHKSNLPTQTNPGDTIK